MKTSQIILKSAANIDAGLFSITDFQPDLMEVEAVAELLGKNATVTGFYSNGEIAGTDVHGECHLHNQTMTITWMIEA